MNHLTHAFRVLGYISEEDQGGIAVILLFGLVIAAVYFAPSAVAFSNGHPHALIIALANTLFGWTVLVWIVTLVWACHKPSPSMVTRQRAAATPPVPHTPRLGLEDDLAMLVRLRDGNLITSEEFAQRRSKILDSLG